MIVCQYKEPRSFAPPLPGRRAFGLCQSPITVVLISPYGSQTILTEDFSKVSVPSRFREGMKGMPMAAARKRHWKLAFVVSASTLQRPLSTARRLAGERPRN